MRVFLAYTPVYAVPLPSRRPDLPVAVSGEAGRRALGPNDLPETQLLNRRRRRRWRPEWFPRRPPRWSLEGVMSPQPVNLRTSRGGLRSASVGTRLLTLVLVPLIGLSVVAGSSLHARQTTAEVA